MELTRCQTDWVQDIATSDGDVLISAGAGAGKSTALAWSALAAVIAGDQVLCNTRQLVNVIEAFPDMRFNMASRRITYPGSPGICWAFGGGYRVIKNLALDVAYVDDIDMMATEDTAIIRKVSKRVVATATPDRLLAQFQLILGVTP